MKVRVKESVRSSLFSYTALKIHSHRRILDRLQHNLNTEANAVDLYMYKAKA